MLLFVFIGWLNSEPKVKLWGFLRFGLISGRVILLIHKVKSLQISLKTSAKRKNKF